LNKNCISNCPCSRRKQAFVLSTSKLVESSSWLGSLFRFLSTSSHPKRRIDRFIRFSTAHVRDQQRDRQTAGAKHALTYICACTCLFAMLGCQVCVTWFGPGTAKVFNNLLRTKPWHQKVKWKARVRVDERRRSACRYDCTFYPRDAMLARVLAMVLYLSVCLSQAGVLSKRMNESNWFLVRELPSTYPAPLTIPPSSDSRPLV